MCKYCVHYWCQFSTSVKHKHIFFNKGLHLNTFIHFPCSFHDTVLGTIFVKESNFIIKKYLLPKIFFFFEIWAPFFMLESPSSSNSGVGCFTLSYFWVGCMFSSIFLFSSLDSSVSQPGDKNNRKLSMTGKQKL